MPKWAWRELQNSGIRICKCGEVTLEDEMHLCRLEDEVEEGDPEVPDMSEFGAFDMAAAGKMGLGLYRAVIRDGGNALEAFNVTAAFFAGLFKGANAEKEED